jgi:hypothetical protein
VGGCGAIKATTAVAVIEASRGVRNLDAYTDTGRSGEVTA